MEATVDVSDQSGKSLADTPRTAPTTAQTTVYAALDQQATDDVLRVIAQNAGRPVKASH